MKRIYIDMDGVLFDYHNAYIRALKENPNQPYPQSQYGFFAKLHPIQDAIQSFFKLYNEYDVWILTRPSTKNLLCYTEKAVSVKEHLGEEVLDKLILSCDKSLLKGDYLIDDQTGFGQEEFEGEFIHFGTEKFPDWKKVLEYLEI